MFFLNTKQDDALKIKDNSKYSCINDVQFVVKFKDDITHLIKNAGTVLTFPLF